MARKDNNTNGEQNVLFEPNIEVKSLPGQTSAFESALNLSPEVHERLLELQQKGLDLNQLLLDFLQKRELEIAQKKEQIREKVLQKEEDYILETPSILKGQTRPHLSVATKKILHEEFGTKCAVKFCQKSAENIHHTLHFSIGKTNDPKFLVPLCKAHHELEHAANYKYRKMRTNQLTTHR